jgi:hypothetical protein
MREMLTGPHDCWRDDLIGMSVDHLKIKLSKTLPNSYPAGANNSDGDQFMTDASWIKSTCAMKRHQKSSKMDITY